MSSYRRDVYSFSVSDSKCAHLLHYTAKADGLSHEVCQAICEELGISMEQSGIFAPRSMVLQGLEMLVALIKNSTGHKFRSTKVQHFIDRVVKPAADDEEFYIHISC